MFKPCNYKSLRTENETETVVRADSNKLWSLTLVHTLINAQQFKLLFWGTDQTSKRNVGMGQCSWW